VATLPPPARPPIAHDPDDGDTVEERLEDTFERTFASLPVPTSRSQQTPTLAVLSEALLDDVLERVGDALNAALEQRVVTPLYYVGGAVALRSMFAPVLGLAIVAFALGAASGDGLEKVFQKSAAAPAALNAAPSRVDAPAEPEPELAAAVALAAPATRAPQRPGIGPDASPPRVDQDARPIVVGNRASTNRARRRARRTRRARRARARRRAARRARARRR